MIAVDVETSGINPEYNSILSIGAVDMANPENTFYGECRAWEGAIVEPQALRINGFTEEGVSDPSKMTEAELVDKFADWSKATERNPIMCGMNVSFDRDFIKAACQRAKFRSPYGYRTLDVHSVAWYYITMNESLPPKNLSLNKILEMLGAGREPEPHNALTGAMCAAECVSRMLSGKTLFPGKFL